MGLEPATSGFHDQLSNPLSHQGMLYSYMLHEHVHVGEQWVEWPRYDIIKGVPTYHPKWPTLATPAVCTQGPLWWRVDWA